MLNPRSIPVGDRTIGPDQPAFVIAEIGINHNRDLELGRKMIRAAAQAGADAVKFQNYRTADFIVDKSITHTYTSNGKIVEESQWDMFRRYELDFEMLTKFKETCDQENVIFLSTPTSSAGIDELIQLQAPLLKNGSDYLVHLDLIKRMARSGIPTILSTGMSLISEIDEAVRSYLEAGGQHLALLHCTSSYPTPDGDVHLRKIATLKETFGFPVGLSDHSSGTVAAIGAVLFGASIVEKHFTLDKQLPGPDHSFSSDPKEFKQLVEQVRIAEKQLGSSHLGPTAQEIIGRSGFRLSCCASKELAAGTKLKRTDIDFYRPGTGIPPAQVDLIVGRVLLQSVEHGSVISLDNLV